MPKSNQMSEAAFLNKKQIKQARQLGGGKKQGSVYYFNNGEPLGSAVRSVLRQLAFVLVVFVLVIAVFWGKSYVQSTLSNDSIFTLTMSSKYSKTVSEDKIDTFTAKKDYGAAAINAISSLVSPEETITVPKNDYIPAVKASLEAAWGEDRVDVRSHVGNYEMMTEIYDAIENGDAVFCLMSLSENQEDESANDVVYCPVIEANYSEDKVVIVTPYGDKRTLKASEFVAATRFTGKTKYSFSERLSFVFGLRAENTIFIVTKE